jgi:SpoVK/Ycf46/Vps4 family AAA+-type ATPase
MDEAFVRRMHVTVDFPLPEEAERLRIWRAIWPAETPLGTDVDLDLIARRFDLPGGHIRNIALAAAFLAADGGTIAMDHVLRAARREYQKLGQVVLDGAIDGGRP